MLSSADRARAPRSTAIVSWASRKPKLPPMDPIGATTDILRVTGANPGACGIVAGHHGRQQCPSLEAKLCEGHDSSNRCSNFLGATQR